MSSIDYNTGFSQLLRALEIEPTSRPREFAAPDDAHTQVRTEPSKETPKEVLTLPANLILKQVVKVSVGWAIGGAIYQAIYAAIEVSMGGIGLVITRAIGRAIGGFIMGQALRTIEPSFQWKEVWLTTMGWAISGAISGVIGQVIFDPGDASMGRIDWAIVRAINWAIGGFIMGQALRTMQPSFQWKEVWITTMGWAITGAIGWTIIISSVFGGNEVAPGVQVVIQAISYGIVGAMGGGTTFWQLISARRKA